MKKMLVIGISGKAHSGKDTLANILVSNYGFVSIAFADKLKRMVRKHYGFKTEELWCDEKSEEVRRVLQGTGQIVKVLQGNHYWVRKLQERILYESLIKETWNNRVVISDVRFSEEKEFIERCGGLHIDIVRPDKRKVEFRPDHISEQDILNWDYQIKNDNTLEQLSETVDTIMAKENISRM